MKSLAIVLIALIPTIMVVDYGMSRDGSAKLNVGGTEFHVPNEFLIDNGLLDFFRQIPGLDRDLGGFLFRFPMTVLQHVPGVEEFASPRSDIVGSVEYLSERDIERTVSSEFFRDLWFGLGSYSDRIIERDDATSFFRVYRGIEYPNAWALIRMDPRTEEVFPKDAFEFWVAHCRNIHTGDTEPVRNGCNSRIVIGRFLIDFSFNGELYEHAELIREEMTRLVLGWMQTS